MRARARRAPSADVLAHPGDGAFACELRRGGVVAPALVAVEAVLGRVEKHPHLGVRCGQFLHAGERDGAVALAEVGAYRTARLLGDRVGHASAVVGDGTGEARYARGAHPTQVAAPAVAD